MKKFKFSLNTVLAYKEQRLELLQGEHAIILGQVREAEEELQRLKAVYLQFDADFRTRCGEGIAITEARFCETRLRAMERDIQLQMRQLEAIRQKAEAKRLEVVEAKQEAASIEKLKARKQEEYRKAEQKDAEQQIDEFVGASFGRRDFGSENE